MITVQRHAGLASLPAAARALMTGDVFSTPAWFRTVVAHGLDEGDRAVFLLATQGGLPAGLISLRAHGRWLSSLTTPYSCAFAPLLAPGLDAAQRTAICAALLRAARDGGVLRLDALDAEHPGVIALQAGARAAGLRSRRFNHFGNWHEAVAGLSWEAYLARRPGSLRSTIRRRGAAATREQVTLTILRDTDGLEAGIAAYEAVYARSWKQAEPFPRFNAALMGALAPLGQLRLGLMHLGGEPIAAQVWLVADGVATVVKLAHDEAHKALSPGTVLTAHMLRHLLDEEHVREIDFGRGDDAYKRDWASQRRQRIGLLLIDPRHPMGLAALGREMLGQAVRRVYPRRKPVQAG